MTLQEALKTSRVMRSLSGDEHPCGEALIDFGKGNTVWTMGGTFHEFNRTLPGNMSHITDEATIECLLNSNNWEPLA